MSEVLTTEIVEPVISPFTTVTSSLRDSTGVPWGQASHVGEFDVAAVGSGDTGKLIIRLRIPANYYCQLAGFHIDTRQTSEPKNLESLRTITPVQTHLVLTIQFKRSLSRLA